MSGGNLSNNFPNLRHVPKSFDREFNGSELGKNDDFIAREVE